MFQIAENNNSCYDKVLLSSFNEIIGGDYPVSNNASSHLKNLAEEHSDAMMRSLKRQFKF